jgi:hypothetical protein
MLLLKLSASAKLTTERAFDVGTLPEVERCRSQLRYSLSNSGIFKSPSIISHEFLTMNV